MKEELALRKALSSLMLPQLFKSGAVLQCTAYVLVCERVCVTGRLYE